jgi:hypothetical protein
MNLKSLSGLMIITLLLSIMTISNVLAQGVPCYPNAFYGDATANGVPAPDGLVVTAEVNGVNTNSSILTANGKYGVGGPPLKVNDNDNDCENGGSVQFFIQGQLAGTADFNNGYVSLLDLSADNVVITKPPSPPPTGGGSPPSGGGPGPATCTPEWSCSDWSQCIDSSQDRECLDLNLCNSDTGKPNENQVCGIESVLPENCTKGETTCVGSSVWECVEEGAWQRAETCENECSAGACAEASEPSGEAPGEGSPITGLDIFAPSTLPYWAILIIVIILIIIYYGIRRRGGKKKK